MADPRQRDAQANRFAPKVTERVERTRRSSSGRSGWCCLILAGAVRGLSAVQKRVEVTSHHGWVGDVCAMQYVESSRNISYISISQKECFGKINRIVILTF